ncbi:hypothetical protein ACH5RR_015008 [Cinchona calisaya]|uniref:Uncharacterized protein n=1 Tax=Cinchona calisaya TaxID=153742 RepID=A0ABD2ZRW1_9GENT
MGEASAAEADQQFTSNTEIAGITEKPPEKRRSNHPTYGQLYDESGGIVDSCSFASDADSYAQRENIYTIVADIHTCLRQIVSAKALFLVDLIRQYFDEITWFPIGPNWKLLLCCTCRAYDAMDEIIAAFSITFSPAEIMQELSFLKTKRRKCL